MLIKKGLANYNKEDYNPLFHDGGICMVLADSSMYSRGWFYRDCRLDRLRPL